MRYLLSLLRKIGWVERTFRRRALPFEKYKVAPRLGVRAVQRRLLMRSRGRSAPFPEELESATEA